MKQREIRDDRGAESRYPAHGTLRVGFGGWRVLEWRKCVPGVKCSFTATGRNRRVLARVDGSDDPGESVREQDNPDDRGQ